MGILKIELEQILAEIDKKNIAIFGAGSYGQSIAQLLNRNQLNFDFYIDNDPQKKDTMINDKPTISANQLLERDLSNVIILICSTWSEEIAIQLQQLQINNFFVIDFEMAQRLDYVLQNKQQYFDIFYNENEKAFLEVMNALEDDVSKETFTNILSYRRTGNPNYLVKSTYDQYFHPLNSPAKDNIIIDGGAFIGDTAKVFSDYLHKECIIHSFEPSSHNFKELEQLASENNHIIPVKGGIGEKTAVLYTKADSGLLDPGYKIATEGEQEVHLFSIDEYVQANKLEKVDLIKLDIEGFELEALKGAMQTIRAYKPTLQICLYHKPEDLIEIPRFMLENFNDLDYQLYIGHHTDSYLETVMYASCKK